MVLSSHRQCPGGPVSPVECIRQDNAGKREAQARAFQRSTADILVTVDSDTYLRPDTLAKLIIPFSKPETMSVGGMAYGQNYTQEPA